MRLEDALGDYLSSDEPGDVEGTAAVLEYLDLCREHFDPARELCRPLWFEDAVWPCFVESICDETLAYYLSADELMLVCELRQQNIVVFGNQRRQALFLGAVTGHAGSPLVLVVLHLGDGQGRVRSHFQRLARVADVRMSRVGGSTHGIEASQDHDDKEKREETREKRGERREKREDRRQTPRGRQRSRNEAARGGPTLPNTVPPAQARWIDGSNRCILRVDRDCVDRIHRAYAVAMALPSPRPQAGWKKARRREKREESTWPQARITAFLRCPLAASKKF